MSDAALARAKMSPLPAARAYALAQALAMRATRVAVPELQRLVLEGTLTEGRVVGVQQAFYFRRAKERDAPGHEPIDFKGTLNTDEDVVVRGTLNSARCAVASGPGNLSGRKSLYLIGTVTSWDGSAVQLRPMFAGTRTILEDDEPDKFWTSDFRRLYPSEIDQFNEVDFTKAPTQSALKALQSLPEKHVKAAFADIIGESFTQVDWGGETSDLYSAQLMVDGRQVSSAWLLKGPGHPGPMTIAALGKRGDQMDRLSHEPAEVLVLQHHREIRSAVVNMMETYARDMRNPRRCMILDGADTARIFAAYGFLG